MVGDSMSGTKFLNTLNCSSDFTYNILDDTYSYDT